MLSDLSVWRRAAMAFLALGCVLVLWRLWSDLAAGGDGWQQGDWLIHAHAGPVRRGLFGSVFLWLHDVTGLSLLGLVLAVQAALVVALFAVTAGLLRDGRLGWLMPLVVFCPAVFIAFWMGNAEGALRKELFAFLALALMARGGLILPALLYLAGLAGHEALIFFLPALLVMAWLTGPLRRALWFAGILTPLALALFGWQALHSQGDPAAICAALVARGIRPEMCGDAIAWVGRASAQHLARPAQILHSPDMGLLIASYAATLLPMGLLLARTTRPRLWLVLLLAAGLPFLPLYVVAIDWGRWMSLHLTSAAFGLIAAVRAGHLAVPARLPLPAPLLILAPLLLLPRHTHGLSFLNLDVTIWAAGLFAAALLLGRLRGETTQDTDA